MNRKTEYDKYKLASVSSKNAIVHTYADAFSIEKVRFQIVEYQTGAQQSFYIDFSQMALLATDSASGKLIAEIRKSERGNKLIQRAGTSKSPKFDGKPEYRTVSIALKDDTVFLNIQSGIGEIIKNGAIKPTSHIDNKLSVAMTIDAFRTLMIYTNNCVNAYLSSFISNMVIDANKTRQQQYNNNKNQQSTQYETF